MVIIWGVAGMFGANRFNQFVDGNGGMDPTQTLVRIKFIELQLKLIKGLQGRYPTEDEGLEELFPKGMAAKNPERVKKLVDDFWGRRIQYRIPGKHHPEGFDLFSYGPDGVEGTEDDITNWDVVVPADSEPPDK